MKLLAGGPRPGTTSTPAPLRAGARPTFTVTALLTVAIVCTLSGWLILADRHTEIERAKGVNQTASLLLAEQVLQLFRESSTIMSVCAAEIRNGGKRGYALAKEVAAAHIADSPKVGYVIFIGSSGDMIWNTAFDPTPRLNVADRDYFRQHQAGMQVIIGDPIIGRSTGKTIIPVTLAIRDAQGKFLGVMGTGIAAATLEGMLRVATPTQSSSAALFRSDGILLARSPSENIGQRFENSEAVKQAETSPRGVFQAISPIDRQDRIVAYAMVRGFPLLVTVSQEKNQVLTSWVDHSIAYGSVMTLAVLGVVFFAWREQRRISEFAREMGLARQVFDTASEAIFVSDLSGRLVDVNAEACRLAKYSRDDMLRLKHEDLVAPEEVKRIAPELAKCDAGAVMENRWLLRCSDGSTLPLDLVVQRLSPDRYLAMGRDLSEKERVIQQLSVARDAAERANRTKSSFLAAASHDLRQPLQALTLFSSALTRTAVGAEQERLCRHLEATSLALGDQLDSLLDISQLDTGAIRPNNEPVDLLAFFQQLDSEFSELALAQGLRFKFWFPAHELVVSTDPRLLRQMLRNLVGNAIRYTRGGGVLVGARRRRDKLLIQVFDTGIGIAPEHLSRIWDEYYQINNPQRDRNQGLGLGLSIVRRLADLQGYAVLARSRPRRGSVFEIAIPCTALDCRPAPEVGAIVDAPLPAPPLPRRQVVLLEDDLLVAESMQTWMEAQGFTVLAFTWAADALDDRRLSASDIYISDFRLPGTPNGIEFLSRMEERYGSPLRAIIITGDTSSATIAALARDHWIILYKPVDPKRLIAAIDAFDA